VLWLTLIRLSLSSDCGMLAEGRRLCDDDGGGGLRPRDVDMVGDQGFISFSGVGNVAGKGRTTGRVVQGWPAGCFSSDEAEAVGHDDDVPNRSSSTIQETLKLLLQLRCRNHFNSLNSSSFLSKLISSPCPSHITHAQPKMDTAIDLSDASKALDLANIRFQLMYTHPTRPNKTCKRQTR
jgi:hypothetical protein